MPDGMSVLCIHIERTGAESDAVGNTWAGYHGR